MKFTFKIEEKKPEYGEPVLVFGKMKKINSTKRWYIAAMDDLKNGELFQDTGDFFWVTENGNLITDVTYWEYLPDYPIVKICDNAVKSCAFYNKGRCDSYEDCAIMKEVTDYGDDTIIITVDHELMKFSDAIEQHKKIESEANGSQCATYKLFTS